MKHSLSATVIVLLVILVIQATFVFIVEDPEVKVDLTITNLNQIGIGLIVTHFVLSLVFVLFARIVKYFKDDDIE